MVWKPCSIRTGLSSALKLTLGLVVLLVMCGWVDVASATPQPPDPQSSPTSLAGPIPKTMFSMAMHSQVLTGMPWPQVGFGGIRLWDTLTNWSRLNPSKGVYDWSLLDEWLNLAESHQVDVLYTFGATPAWAAANATQACQYHPGACSPPADMSDWDNFVRALVTHSNGRIKYWELWNEPNVGETWAGDVQTMALMAHRAYTIIKSIDPNAVVLTPTPAAGLSNFAAWWISYIAAGGGDSADVVAFHGYLPYLPPTAAAPEALKDVVDSINSVMSATGQINKPIWDTEASWGTADLLPDLDAQAAYVARSYILHWSLGVQRFYWYAWNNTLWGTLWNGTSQTIVKPGIAYGETYKWLVGATLTSPCSVADNSTWTCFLSRPGGYDAEIIWNPATPVPSSQPFAVDPHFAQYRDLDGNITSIAGSMVPVGGKPILLEPYTGISLSRSVLKFNSNVSVGVQTDPQTLLVTNTGSVPLLLAGAETTGDYSLINTCGDSVAIAATCAMNVTLQPTAAGLRTGSLLIHDNSPGSPHTVLLTNGRTQVSVSLFPSTLDFSSQVIGAAPTSKKVTMTNVGDQTVAISGPSIGDATQGSDFALSENTCSSPIVPGGNCSVTVTFSPDTTGVQTAVLAATDVGVVSNDITMVPLSGAGWDFTLSLRDGTPASLSPLRSGSYDLDVTPLGGFIGTIALAVSCNLTGAASCAVTPSSVNITDTSPMTIHVQVDPVHSASLSILLGSLAVLLLGMAFRFHSLPALILALVSLAGCSGAVGNNGHNTSNVTPSPSSIVVTAVSQGATRTLSLPLSPP